MTGSVNVVQREQSLIVASYSPTDVGPLVINDWMTVVPATIGDDELGSLVVQALEVGEQEIAYPPRTELGPNSPRMRRLYDLAGIRTFKEYMTASRSVTIDTSGDHLVITAEENKGTSRGFQALDFTITLDTRNAHDVGGAVRRALKHAI